VGQGEEDNVKAPAGSEGVLIGWRKDDVGVRRGEAGMDGAEVLAGLGARGSDVNVEVGVGRAQPEQLGPGESRGANDADACHFCRLPGG
jgi:hypothetical protein